MIKMIKDDMDNTFFDLIESASKNIKLCAPFVKRDVAQKILKQKKKSSKLSLITNCNLNYFHKKSSDIEALELIIKGSGNIANCQNLHAKFYIFDDSKIIITSANLTYSGFNKNIEYGILSDEINITGEVIGFYNSIINNEKNSFVDINNIETIKTILAKSPKISKRDYIDETAEIFSSDKNIIFSGLKGWTKLIFSVLDGMKKDIVELNDFVKYYPYLHERYPANNNIDAKVRQQMQVLRNIGLIKFEGRGVYKKLWE